MKRLISALFILALILPVNTGAAGKVYTIVIDPGHGGKDPGSSSRGKNEKTIALQISKRLARRIKKEIPSRVILTRSSDKFISLSERNRISKKAKADLFISLHTNAAKRRAANGIEIYYLNNASDKAAERLASRENRGHSKKDDVGAILGAMMQNAFTEESNILAKFVKEKIQSRLSAYRMERMKIKSALFHVLIAPGCPGLLIETGFITNRKEGNRLANPKYQEKLAAGITDGIKKYIADSSKVRRNL